MKTLFLQCIALLFFCIPSIYAKVYYANSRYGNDSYSGLNPLLALKTFHAASLKAVDGDTIFCSGVFDWSSAQEVGDKDRYGYTLDKNISIIGDSANKTIFQSAPTPKSINKRVFYIPMYKSIVMKNLIIRNGYLAGSDAEGAGIYCGSYTSLKMKNCIIENNHNLYHYGFLAAGGIHSEFNYGYHTANLLDLENVIIRYNSSLLSNPSNYYTVNGGGISVLRTRLNMRNCTVHDNYSFDYAAALYTKEAKVNISNCTFCDNKSKYENILFSNIQRHNFITNCTFAYNQSYSNQNENIYATITAIYSDTFLISMRNNIFYKNVNYNGSDNMYFKVASNFKNKIEWRNNYFQNGFLFFDNNLQPDNLFQYSPESFGNILGNSVSVLLSRNLSLNNSPDGIPTLELLENSSLVDKGINDNQIDQYTSEIISLSDKDQRKKNRINQVDLGAFEYYPTEKMNEINKNQSISDNNYLFSDLIIDKNARIDFQPSDSLMIENGLIIEGNDSSIAEISSIKNLHFKTPLAKIIYKYKFKKGGWRFFSLPFSIASYDIFKNGLYYPASWGDPVNYSAGKDFYIAKYNGQKRAELNNSTGNWENINERVLNAGQGYIIAVDTDIELFFVCDSLNLNQLNDSKTLPNYNYNTDCSYFNYGWNFTGNPLTSSSNISPRDLNNPIYVFNNQNYETFVEDETLNLKPFQAFFFQSNSTDSLNFISVLNSNQTPVNLPEYKSSSELIKIEINNAAYNDITKINKGVDATSGFDKGIDAFKLISMNKSVPQIFTTFDNVNFAYNKIPMDQNEIELIVIAPDTGMYQIKLSEKKISTYNNIILVDSSGRFCADLIQNNYSFHSTIRNEELKFKLIFDNLNDISHLQNDDLKIKKNGYSVEIQTNKEDNYIEIFDAAGKSILQMTKINDKLIFEFKHSGVYLFKIYNKDQNDVKKILI